LQFAEKLGLGASGAEALEERQGFVAALKALRHPKLKPPKSGVIQPKPESFSKLLEI